MSPEKEEVRRLLDVLHTLMRMLAISNREVERRLKLNHATVSRLMNGTIEAKLETILGVARAIGLEYEEFFSFAYPGRLTPGPESESARRIRSMLSDLRPGARPMSKSVSEAAPGPLERTELYDDVKKAIREILEEREQPVAEQGGGRGDGRRR